MVKSSLFQLKVAVPKPKRNKVNHGIVRTSNKIVKGKVFQDEEGNYTVSIIDENNQDNPRILSFTERSFDLTNKINVFSRTLDEHGRRNRYIRDALHAKYMPGSPERYVPFAPNWIITGYIVKDNGIEKFDFNRLIGIDGYNMIITYPDEE